MIVVHPSAVLTLLLNEPGCNAIAAKLCEAPDAVISPVAAMDLLLTLSARFDDPAPILSAFLKESRIAQRPVDGPQTAMARQGYLTFGLGVWGLADSFTYGAAKTLEAPVLVTTDIFAKSDLRVV